jgi:hypothetical protein
MVRFHPPQCDNIVVPGTRPRIGGLHYPNDAPEHDHAERHVRRPKDALFARRVEDALFARHVEDALFARHVEDALFARHVEDALFARSVWIMRSNKELVLLRHGRAWRSHRRLAVGYRKVGELGVTY